jgi:hypothetical protein
MDSLQENNYLYQYYRSKKKYEVTYIKSNANGRIKSGIYHLKWGVEL